MSHPTMKLKKNYFSWNKMQMSRNLISLLDILIPECIISVYQFSPSTSFSTSYFVNLINLSSEKSKCQNKTSFS